MTRLQSMIDADGWVFVQGVTIGQSVDPVGPAATSAKIDVDQGSHYAGVYRASSSAVILRAFFDGYDTTHEVNLPLGYVQTISAQCLGAPISPILMPGLARLSPYASSADTVLDFMGQTDARARFANLSLGDAKADLPFYPFNVFLRRPNPQFQDVFWHPMPNGSMRPSATMLLQPGNRPTPEAQVSQVASLRAVVRPFLIEEAQLAAICLFGAATYQVVLTSQVALGASIAALVSQLYIEKGDTLPQMQEALAAGPYLVLLTTEQDAYVARLDPHNDGYLLTVWELDHDSFERIEQDAALNALNILQNACETRYSALKILASAPPSGRGARGIKAIPDVGRVIVAPTFSLIFTATLCTWPRSRGPNSTIRPLSSISTRVDWIYDPINQDLDVKTHAPTASAIPADFMGHCKNYQKLLTGSSAPLDLADPTPFTLVDAPWLDTAPTSPRIA